MEKVIQKIPTVAMRGLTVLPGMHVQFEVARARSIAAVERAMLKDQRAFLVTQQDTEVEEPTRADLYRFGTIVRLKQLIKSPGKGIRVIAEGEERGELIGLEEEVGSLMGQVVAAPVQPLADEDPKLEQAMIRELQGQFQELMKLEPKVQKEGLRLLNGPQESLAEFMDTLIGNLSTDYVAKQKYLNCEKVSDGFTYLSDMLRDELEIKKIESEISNKVKERIDKNQREYVLREHRRMIDDELGDQTPAKNVDQYREQLNQLVASDEIKEKIEKEIRHLNMLSHNPTESAMMQTYVETLLELPWDKMSQDKLDLKHAKAVLDEDHYGLCKVKERVLEFLAVRGLTEKGDAPVICLVGPPGTGKTSIARSVARALNREYVRICLGGVRDEAEIRGHRKTYVGAMPGRIVTGLKSVGVKNPVMLLDEIDKLGSDHRGDPSAAMLEVLDGEQNTRFVDHYVEAPVDLSEVLFIATANDAGSIPRPLLDRMEIIEVSSYIANEKFHIAKQHLLAKQIRKNGLKRQQLSITDKALQQIIAHYTREAGVRGLERKLAEICRKTALQIMEGDVTQVKVSQRNLTEFLGKELFQTKEANSQDAVGIVRGLAWTSVGGTTLQIEVNVMPGKGECKLTGKLGDVMKESAMAGISYIRSVSEQYQIPETYFQTHDIHIHIPEGAVPKDGPSAGITMATAVLSAITGIPVNCKVAMTGEITLRGRVLPIGGLKEKMLAAKVAGMKTVLVPFDNKPDVDEIEEEILEGLRVVPVETMEQVLKEAFVKKSTGDKVRE